MAADLRPAMVSLARTALGGAVGLVVIAILNISCTFMPSGLSVLLDPMPLSFVVLLGLFLAVASGAASFVAGSFRGSMALTLYLAALLSYYAIGSDVLTDSYLPSIVT